MRTWSWLQYQPHRLPEKSDGQPPAQHQFQQKFHTWWNRDLYGVLFFQQIVVLNSWMANLSPFPRVAKIFFDLNGKGLFFSY